MYNRHRDPGSRSRAKTNLLFTRDNGRTSRLSRDTGNRTPCILRLISVLVQGIRADEIFRGQEIYLITKISQILTAVFHLALIGAYSALELFHPYLSNVKKDNFHTVHTV